VSLTTSHNLSRTSHGRGWDKTSHPSPHPYRGERVRERCPGGPSRPASPWGGERSKPLSVAEGSRAVFLTEPEAGCGAIAPGPGHDRRGRRL